MFPFFFFAPLVHFTEVSSAQLKKPSLAAAHRGRADQGNSLINSLLTQRPKRVSHLLKDNFPADRECRWCPFETNVSLWQAVAPEPAAAFQTAVFREASPLPLPQFLASATTSSLRRRSSRRRATTPTASSKPSTAWPTSSPWRMTSPAPWRRRGRCPSGAAMTTWA